MPKRQPARKPSRPKTARRSPRKKPGPDKALTNADLLEKLRADTRPDDLDAQLEEYVRQSVDQDQFYELLPDDLRRFYAGLIVALDLAVRLHRCRAARYELIHVKGDTPADWAMVLDHVLCRGARLDGAACSLPCFWSEHSERFAEAAAHEKGPRSFAGVMGENAVDAALRYCAGVAGGDDMPLPGQSEPDTLRLGLRAQFRAARCLWPFADRPRRTKTRPSSKRNPLPKCVKTWGNTVKELLEEQPRFAQKENPIHEVCQYLQRHRKDCPAIGTLKRYVRQARQHGHIKLGG